MPEPISFSQSTAKVAAWNLAGFHPIPEERRKLQAKGLALLDAEVVTLVEINPPEVLSSLKTELAKFGLEYESTLVPQASDLNIGILHKKGVEVSNASLMDGSDLGDAGKRKAFVADVKVGKLDFHLIAVHLKSGRTASNQATRDEQCKVIGQYITERRAQSREDILLMGDFNMIPGQDISNFHHLGGADLMDFVSSWDLQDRFSHILDKGRANLLDGFAISRTYSTEYVRGSLRLFPMHWSMDIGREHFKDTVSDHLPFVATFRIDKALD